MNSLLVESNYVINKKYILPKSCVRVLLKFSYIDVIQAETTHSKEEELTMDMHCSTTLTCD